MQRQQGAIALCSALLLKRYKSLMAALSIKTGGENKQRRFSGQAIISIETETLFKQ